MFSTQYSKLPKAGRIFIAVTGGLIFAVALGLVLAFLVQFLWNQTIAAMFDLPAISYWQALGLFILAKLFFGLGSSRRHFVRRYKKGHHRRHRRPGVESEDGSDPVDDTMFKEYWQEEGKDAYEAFLAIRGESQKERGDNESNDS